jgi:hypothetical protein
VERRLRSLDQVVDRLAADAVVAGDLGQREILQVIGLDQLLLPRGE